MCGFIKSMDACRIVAITAFCFRIISKGAHLAELCGQRGIPLVFLQNITGFMVEEV